MTVAKPVCIIGLGMIGGSIARDLTAHGIRVAAYDTNAASTAAALDAGVIDEVLPDVEQAHESGIVIIATPIRAIPSILQRLAASPRHAPLIMDTGSSKARVIESAELAGLGAFVGAHPLAGDHRAGWDAARAGMFRNATVFLCPTRVSSSDALERATTFWTDLGARPVIMDPATHDERLAWISHLPQVVSSALAASIAEQRLGRTDLGPAGREMTRVAASDARMWTDILMTNRANAGRAAYTAAHRLTALAQALDSGDEQAVLQFLTDGNALT